MQSNTKDNTQPNAETLPQNNSLKRQLNSRHIHFIALGSAIGTGLFYGSAAAIQAAGPSVLLAYLLGGTIVYLVLRALGEMAVANPVSGSFGEYARKYLGRWSGYITGWTYAFEMVVVCLADVTAFAIYMKLWWPDVPAWVWVGLVIIVIGAANLLTVRVFGELEFAFSVIKVGAIIAMIVGGAIILIMTYTHKSVAMAHDASISNLWDHSGFAPHGISGLAAAFILVMFAFGGTEIIGVTAGEAQKPEETIPKAVNTVPIRIFLFYFLALLVILMLQPWDQITGESSPFVEIFQTLGLPWAASLLNFVVITAALSAINSDLFGAGRVLHGLASQGLAPRFMSRTSRKGVPIMTVSFMIGILIIGAILNYAYPAGLFAKIAVLATFATVFVWLMILLSHLASRYRLSAQEKARLKFPVPFGISGQVVAIIAILGLFVIIGVDPALRDALWVGLLGIALMSAVFLLFRRSTDSGASPVVTARSTLPPSPTLRNSPASTHKDVGG